MSSTTIVASILVLLVFSLIVFKVVQMLARPRGAMQRAPRVGRTAKVEEMPESNEASEDLVEEESPSWASDELEEPGEEFGVEEERSIEEKKKPMEKALEKKQVKKEQITPKKKLSSVSPQDYPACFGTPEAYENCERGCGVVEECESTISVLKKFTD